jgi:dolichol-phosphate mannosyltransferase
MLKGIILMNKIDSDWQLPIFDKKVFFKKKHSYCLGIPIINEGERFKKQLRKLKKYTSLVDILIFDGGSSDGSTDLLFLKKMGVRAFLIKKSPGKQGTQLRMGFAYALQEGYEGVITIDGNNKDGVEAIPHFLALLKKGKDFMQGSRYQKGGRSINTPHLRHIGNHLILAPLFSLAAGFHFTDVTNGFRAYSKKLLLDPQVKPFRDIFISYELIFYLGVRAAQLGYKVTEIPVVRRYPRHTVPTKIKGLASLLQVFKVGIQTTFGYYNP